MNKLPSLKALHVFEVTARHLSFSKAADELCVSQSAVSHQIKLLESSLGKSLFKREHNQVSLTVYGGSLFAVTSDSFKRIKAITDNLSEQSRPSLKVMAQSAIAVDWLAPRIAFFNELNPNIDVVLSIAVSDLDFDASEYDIIVGTWPAPINFVTQKIREEKWFPVATHEVMEQVDSDEPLSLLGFTLFSSENGQDWQTWMQTRKIDELLPTNITHFSNTILATKACLSGKGVALSCGFLADDLIERGQLTALKHLSYELPWGHFFIHYRQESLLSKQVDAFVDWVMSSANKKAI